MGGEKCLDYGYIIETEVVKCGDDLDVVVKERKESIITPKFFVLSNWKT